jgi:hypothetical protein
LILAAGGRLKWSTIGDFGVGALIPALILLGYNQLAFGSPWDLGYFHLTTKEFADVHASSNPLGLRSPQLSRVVALLIGRHRGLTFFAPIVLLTPFGLVSLARRGLWGMAGVAVAVMAAVFAVNLSYPAWTGGWSTGPRLLTPLLPFAVLPVASLLARDARWTCVAALGLTLAGGVLILMFVAVGARVPQYYEDPLGQAVWVLWRGGTLPEWTEGPFARNLARLVGPRFIADLPKSAQCLQFLPLVLFQAAGIAGIMATTRRPVECPSASQDAIKPAC